MQDISRLPHFVQAGVLAVHADHVELDCSTTQQLDQPAAAKGRQPESSHLAFDYLAICTGASTLQRRLLSGEGLLCY